jgi:hypothetical protein
MTRRLGVLIAAVVCSANLPLQAHHAIGETYDEERTIVLKGEVSSFLFGNPHSMIQLRVLDDQGAAHTWALEWRGAGHLQQLAWTDNALTTGDHVRICGNPGRDPGAYRLYLLNLAVMSSDSGAVATSDGNLCTPTLRGPAASPTASR